MTNEVCSISSVDSLLEELQEKIKTVQILKKYANENATDIKNIFLQFAKEIENITVNQQNLMFMELRKKLEDTKGKILFKLSNILYSTSLADDTINTEYVNDIQD